MFFMVGPRYSERTHHHAHPAADTFFLIMQHRARLRVAFHRTGHAGFNTRGILAMPALESKRQAAFFLHRNGGTGSGIFVLERLEDFF
jgi:hypothetical protein